MATKSFSKIPAKSQVVRKMSLLLTRPFASLGRKAVGWANNLGAVAVFFSRARRKNSTGSNTISWMNSSGALRAFRNN